MIDFSGSSEFYFVKEEEEKKVQKQVTFDDSNNFWYQDSHVQQDRRHICYTREELASFRKQSRKDFMEWSIRSNFHQRTFMSFLDHYDSSSSSNAEEDEEDMSCLRGLESYYERQMTASACAVEKKEDSPRRRIVNYQKNLKLSNNNDMDGFVDPKKLAAYSKSLSQDSVVKCYNRAIEDWKIARTIYQDDFSTNHATSTTFSSDDDTAIDFVGSQFSFSSKSTTVASNPSQILSRFLSKMSPTTKKSSSSSSLRRVLESSKRCCSPSGVKRKLLLKRKDSPLRSFPRAA